MTAKVFAAGLVALVAFGCTDPPTTPTALNDQPFFSQGGVPGDGNGNKDVFSWDDTFLVTCISGEVITLNDVGWAQFRSFGPPNNRNVELGVFHLVETYTNAGGDTFVWRDVGTDRIYFSGDEVFVSIVGTSTASGNINRDVIVVGRVVLKLDAPFGDPVEVVSVAGRELGAIDDLACAVLT